MNHSHPPLNTVYPLIATALMLLSVSCAIKPQAKHGDSRTHDREESRIVSHPTAPDASAPPQLPAAKPPEKHAAVTAASVVPVARTYEEDTFHLFALIESWPGSNADETGRLLAEEFIKVVRPSFPEVSQARWNELAREFQPKAVATFRNRTAAVCREHFSHEEIRQLIQFYETPVGRKYARAFTEVVNKMRAYDPQRKIVMAELVIRIRNQGSEPRTSKSE